MNVCVCVGSSCHLKDSYNIINLMLEALKDNNLEDKVNLSASFCLGRCTDGVTIKIDDEIICGVSKDNFASIFSEYVLKKLENQLDYNSVV
jgi:Respiratory-chain NADH dehydrogenase 24 Kd subunit.